MNPEDLAKRLQELEEHAEHYYPEQIEELARLLHEGEEVVKNKIEYLARTRSQSKYIVLDTVLSYHRIQW